MVYINVPPTVTKIAGTAHDVTGIPLTVISLRVVLYQSVKEHCMYRLHPYSHPR